MSATVSSVARRAKGKSIYQLEQVVNSLHSDCPNSIKQAWQSELNKKKKDQCAIISLPRAKLESADDLVVKKYKSLKNSAKDRGKDFNLTLSDVRKLINRKTCAYTGMRLTRTGDKSPSQATIDRFDPRLGYVKGNVYTVSNAANQIKEHIFEGAGCCNMNLKQLQKFTKVMGEMGLDKVI